MFAPKVWLAILLRCLLEFGPPTAFAIYSTYPDVTSSKIAFSAAFVAFGLFWWNFLRIHYQQTNRAKQDRAADVIDSIRADLVRVEDSLNEVMPLVRAGNLPAAQEEAIGDIVRQANDSLSVASDALKGVADEDAERVTFRRLVEHLGDLSAKKRGDFQIELTSRLDNERRPVRRRFRISSLEPDDTTPAA